MESQGKTSGRSDDQSAMQAATLLAPEQMEHAGVRSARKPCTRRVVVGVLLLCLLIVIILAVVFALKQTSKGHHNWLKDDCEDIVQPQCPKSFSKPPVILVSMDGFRAEYLEAHGNVLPVISKLRSCGTSTRHMRPTYPTKTFPNHYTIVTGLYPESHGIVDNKMYDVNTNTFFSLRSDEKYNKEWYLGQPIWLTAMYNKLKAGTFFWPGTDVNINGSFPNLYQKYNWDVSFETRVETIMEWLDLPAKDRPDFYTLYLEEPDTAGHRYGPMSNEVIDALKRVDDIIGLLMDRLKEKELHKCVNLILLSDHGMEEASCIKSANVSDYQENTNDFIVIQGPAGRIRPSKLPEDFFSFDYEGLVKNLSCRVEVMKPYLKEHLPKRFHFAKSVRIERGHLYMEEQWQAALKPGDIKYCKGGFHGSDNVFKNMQAIFIGHGPALKSQTMVPPFENIEVYNLLCDLLGIPPAPNNGTHGSLNHLLKKPVHIPVFPAELSPASQCTVAGLTLQDDLGCTCSSLTKPQVEKMNDKLRGYNSDSGFKPVHLPYGIPRVLRKNANYCVLYHSDYITGYSKDTLMALWVAYTVKPQRSVQPLRPGVTDCIRVDVRILPNDSQSCHRAQNISLLTFGLLHPPNLGTRITESDSLITTNMAPMFSSFKEVWTYFHDILLVKYSQELNGINVMSGPVFDQNFDGIYDTLEKIKAHEAPVPTHFFVILTSCGDSSSLPDACNGPLKALTFILPHRPDNREACANGTDYSWVEKWAQMHTARVRDVELLTGLSFYHDRISVEETLQLKTFMNIF